MMQMPPALAPWEEALRALTPDIIETIGGWLPRLDALVGQWFQSDDVHGEPDGYASITRRGPYERLLLSEWALADLYPDEFVRRALAGEHAFFSLQHKATRRERQLRIVLDAGPEQLGAPRLLHIALLVVLARRAAASKLPFTFVTTNGEAASPTVDENSVRKLMAARVLDSELDQVDALRTEYEDIWWIGGPSLCAAAGDDGVRVCIEQPWRADAPHLRVACQWERHRPSPIQLPLPEDRVASRVLRWEPKPKDTPVQQVDEELILSPDGNRLFVREPSGRVVAHHVPGPNMQPGRPRFHPPQRNERIVAAGLSAGRLLMVGVADGKLRIKNGANLHVVTPDEMPPMSSLRLCLNDGQSTNFIDDNGALWMVNQVAARKVLPRCRAMGYGLFIGDNAIFERSGDQLTTARDLTGDFIGRALVGGSEGTAAVEVSYRNWLVFTQRLKKETWLGVDAHVIGLVNDTQPMLVAIDADRHAISFVGVSGGFSTPRTKSPIVAATMSINGKSLAYRTFSGSLRMYSVARRAVTRTLRVAT